MNVLDLFSGIGGFSVGLEAAGMRTVAFCEIEKYPQKILKQHWPEVPIFNDIRTLTAEQLPEPIDLICGGYPCQPFSVAGKQRGAEDERHLWPEVLRLIQSIRPRWVFCENVAGHIQLGFDEVATSLENEGYTVWAFIIPACAVNAPHRRDRVWIIGNAKHNGLPSSTQSRKFGETNDHEPQGKKEFSQSARPISLWDEVDADTNNKRCERGEQRVFPSFKKRYFEKNIDEDILQHYRQGNNLSTPRICRIHDGISNRTHRLKALGNAIVPQIAYLIGKTIIEYESSN